MKSYLKQAVAYIKGDTENVIAEKNYRKLTNAIKGQISTLTATKDNKVDDLDNAKEALNKLKFPETTITDAARQLQRILEQQEVVDEINEEIADIDHTIDVLAKLQAGFDEEVAEEAAVPAASK